MGGHLLDFSREFGDVNTSRFGLIQGERGEGVEVKLFQKWTVRAAGKEIIDEALLAVIKSTVDVAQKRRRNGFGFCRGGDGGGFDGSRLRNAEDDERIGEQSAEQPDADEGGGSAREAVSLSAQGDEEEQAKTEPENAAEWHRKVADFGQGRDDGERRWRGEAILVGPGEAGDGGRQRVRFRGAAEKGGYGQGGDVVDEALPEDLKCLWARADRDLPHESEQGLGLGEGFTCLKWKGASGFSLDDLSEDERGLKR